MALQMERISISEQESRKGKVKKTSAWEDQEHRRRREQKRKHKKGKKHAEFQMEEHKESIDEVLARHRTSLSTGLSTAEAEERLARDGPNVLTPVKKKPEWLVFLEQFTSVFAMLLWIGAILSFVRTRMRHARRLTRKQIAYGLDTKGVDNLYIAIVLVLVVVISGIFSYVQVR